MSLPHRQLNDAQRQDLERLTAAGTLPARVFKRARALLLLDQGHTLQAVGRILSVQAVGRILSVSAQSVANWRDRFGEEALAVLFDKPRSGRPVEIDGTAHALVTALACSADISAKAGRRFTQVFERRRKQEYAQFMKALADHYAARRPEVRRVHLVQDTLNTHPAGAFYENFDAETAHDLEQFYQPHYTPKGASWLNMAEIELSAMSRQCLLRRIASQEMLARETRALTEERNEKQITIQWEFSVETTRQTLNRHYRAAHPDNAMYQRT